MSATRSQTRRIAKFSTPLGDDVLVASRFDASEAMSDLFDYRVEALSSDPDIEFDALLGRNATMSIETPDGGTRFFDGIVVEAQWFGQRTEDFAYRFVLRPWLFLLKHRTDCRIFHERSAPEIVAEVLSAHPFAVFEDRLTKPYPSLEYTVQYRESDFDFCSRLMERHGIGYYFRHEKGAHVLVLSDSLSSYDLLPGPPRPFYPKERREHVDGEHVNRVVPQRRFTSGRVTLNAYDFKKPSADLKSRAQGETPYEHAGLERYDYPGQYIDSAAGTAYAGARMAAEKARDGQRSLGGDMPSASPGALFQITGHPLASENVEYLVISADHSFGAQGYRSGDHDETAYQGRYEVMAADLSYAPPMTTEKPRVFGPQTAVVVGEGEIDVDEYGRILVRFHWDRHADRSRRVRVSQASASNGWGAMVIPRIGMEVVVDFLEGDPDEPIVTGCVYNGRNKPADTLPQFKTRSGFRTDTHKGAGYNELRFEDEKDQQEVFLQAERDLNGRIKKDETWTVGGSAHRRVDGNQSESIGGARDMEIGGEHREHVLGSRHQTIDGSRRVRIAGSDVLKILGNKVLNVARNVVATIDGSYRLATGGAQAFEAGTEVVIEAGTSISLNVGGNFIRIDHSGVQIEGALVRVNCGGVPGRASGLPAMEASEPAKVAGPHAKRTDRSFKS